MNLIFDDDIKMWQVVSNINKLPPDLAWHNTEPIPPIGTTVQVLLNDLGMGVVQGYFYTPIRYTDGKDYLSLGVEVKLTDPPDWWRQRNPGPNTCRLLGSEIVLKS